MTSLHVVVTAEHIAAADELNGPVERALAERSGVGVEIDAGDGDGTMIATIGLTSGCTLVVELPDAASERIRSHDDGGGMEPFEFDVELDAWLVALVPSAV